jgi:hypothetical protein
VAKITKKAIRAMTAGELAKFLGIVLERGRPSKALRKELLEEALEKA